MVATRAEDAHCHIAYVNQVGGQDELIFDGASFVVDDNGELVHRMPQLREGIGVVDLDIRPVFRTRLLDPRGRDTAPALPVVRVSSAVADHPGDVRPPAVHDLLPRVDEVYDALVLATRDYVTKNGFTDVVFGLSGGIDSSLVALIAADAIGAEHVHAVSMPSRYSSEGSKTDADALCDATGIELRTIAIEPAFLAFTEMLGPSFEGLAEDLTEENLQPRIRGTLLMALSNKFRGWLVLTTGNKSELAVGYSTLYGDTAGGFAVIKDVPKLLVYDLCRLRNERAGTDVIPEAVLTKPPSAELRPGPARRPVVAAVRGAGPAARGLRRGRCHPWRARRAGVRPVARRADHPARRPLGVQAPAEPAWPSHQPEGLRQGPPHAHHERLPRMSSITAVLFDFAGVLTSSPWVALTAAGGGNLELLIGSYEEDTDHPWHQVERGEMAIADWATAVTETGRQQGIEVDFAPLRHDARRHDPPRADPRSGAHPAHRRLPARAHHQQRARGLVDVALAGPRRRAVRRRGGQLRGRHAQAEPGHLPPRPRPARRCASGAGGVPRRQPRQRRRRPARRASTPSSSRTQPTAVAELDDLLQST